MTATKNNPITLELGEYLQDMLAQWVRADAELMRPVVDRVERLKVREQRVDLADSIVRSVLHALPAFSAEGDFADALNERAEAYADYKAAQAAEDN